LFKPCNIGPMKAPVSLCTALYVLFPVFKSGK
jgi:hypothetical protein